jgi:hypothetical protein
MDESKHNNQNFFNLPKGSPQYLESDSSAKVEVGDIEIEQKNIGVAPIESIDGPIEFNHQSPIGAQ